MGFVRINKLWPRKDIPFAMSKKAEQVSGSAIQGAINEWNTFTKINFMPLKDYIPKHGFTTNFIKFVFAFSPRCSSPTGKQGGVQYIKCRGLQESVLVHELGHAIGLKHEHSRPDRDQHVFVYPFFIQYSVLKPRDFSKFYPPHFIPHGNYDCRSVMHYGVQTVTTDSGDVDFFGPIPGTPCAGGIFGGFSKKRLPDGRTSYLTQTDIDTVTHFYA